MLPHARRHRSEEGGRRAQMGGARDGGSLSQNVDGCFEGVHFSRTVDEVGEFFGTATHVCFVEHSLGEPPEEARHAAFGSNPAPATNKAWQIRCLPGVSGFSILYRPFPSRPIEFLAFSISYTCYRCRYDLVPISPCHVD